MSADTVAHLYFELMKQIITLSIASAGGALTLIQTLLEDSEARAFATAGVFFLVVAA